MKFLQALNRRSIYLALLAVCSTLLAMAVVILPLYKESLSPAPKEGQVATQDYRAPRPLTYVSQFRTEQRRKAAEEDVSAIYTAPDTRVARRQLEQLRAAQNYITSVRADAYADSAQKITDLAALEDVHLSPIAVQTVLGLSDADWQTTQQSALSVLERMMSSAIRPETLSEARLRAPSLVSLSLSEDQAAAVAELAAGFVVPNSEYSAELTAAERQKARDAQQPVTRTFIAGQTVVLQGELLDADDIEALYELGLAEPSKSLPELFGAALMTLLMVIFVSLYLHRKHSLSGGSLRKVGILVVLGMLFLTLTRLAIPTHPVAPYVMPLAAYTLTTAALYGMELALVTSLPLAVLSAYGLPNALEMTLYFLVCSSFGGLVLGRARRLLSFLVAGLAVGFSGLGVLFVFHLPAPTEQPIGLGLLTAAALISGLTSTSIAILLQSMLAQSLGLVTSLQLVDLTRPDHPLVRRLLREAPGTYQHSLQVANLAEQAAERIGADALLTRVGALYHDVGKTANPVYYIENQPPGFANPHDGLAPEESARQIIRHVRDGLVLGRSHHLPQRVLDFVLEHHGTGLTRYQYGKAVKAAGGDESKVDPNLFRYPGPRPQSRETAILMLADGCEARVRAERPATDEQMRNVIKAVISDRITHGQLDDTKLTLNDLALISDSFFFTLRGFYHPRLDYSKEALPAAGSSALPEPAQLPPGAPAEAETTALPASGEIPTLPRKSHIDLRTDPTS